MLLHFLFSSVSFLISTISIEEETISEISVSEFLLSSISQSSNKVSRTFSLFLINIASIVALSIFAAIVVILDPLYIYSII